MPRLGLGLALSGGGFRATLLHLGVVRFLRDACALRDVTDIAAVSGGSILAAHLALNWDRYNGDEQRFAEAVAQIVEFVQYDVRNHIVRRLPLLYSLRFVARRMPGRGRNLTANAVLERYYARFLYGDRCLYELPETPTLHILASNVRNGGRPEASELAGIAPGEGPEELLGEPTDRGLITGPLGVGGPAALLGGPRRRGAGARARTKTPPAAAARRFTTRRIMVILQMSRYRRGAGTGPVHTRAPRPGPRPSRADPGSPPPTRRTSSSRGVKGNGRPANI
jgi:hypothetical protein